MGSVTMNGVSVVVLASLCLLGAVIEALPKQYKGTRLGSDATGKPIYRYRLWRVWNKTKPMLLVIGCNPSTADGTFDDPTIKKVKWMAKLKGYGGIYMGNLYAYRNKDPNKMYEKAYEKGFSYVVGPSNDYNLRMMAYDAADVVLAYGNIAVADGWGHNQYYAERHAEIVSEKMKKLMSLKKKKGKVYAFALTSQDVPSHPLWLSPYNTWVKL